MEKINKPKLFLIGSAGSESIILNEEGKEVKGLKVESVEMEDGKVTINVDTSNIRVGGFISEVSFPPKEGGVESLSIPNRKDQNGASKNKKS